MKPSRSSRHRRPPTAQLSLPLQVSPITALNTPDRISVIALLARLLVEAVRPACAQEDADDAS